MTEKTAGRRWVTTMLLAMSYTLVVEAAGAWKLRVLPAEGKPRFLQKALATAAAVTGL